MTTNNSTIDERATDTDATGPLPDNVVLFPIRRKTDESRRGADARTADRLNNSLIADIIEFHRKPHKPQRPVTLPPPDLGSESDQRRDEAVARAIFEADNLPWGRSP